MKYIGTRNILFAVIPAGLLAVTLYGGWTVADGLHKRLLVLQQEKIEQVRIKSILFPRAVSLSQDALIAKAAILYDPANGRVLFEKNSDAQLPLASLTKLMTAQVALAHNPENAQVVVTKEDVDTDGDGGLHAGDILSLSGLIKLGIVASSNDAMAAVAGSIGPQYLEAMNIYAKKQGLSKTYFANPTGLDVDAATAGAYGSARDIAHLTASFFKAYPKYFEYTTKSSVFVKDGDRVLSSLSTSLPLHDIPGLIGAKTGYTDLAGGNLSVVFDVEIGHPLVAVVLGSTESGRFTDIKTIISIVRQIK